MWNSILDGGGGGGGGGGVDLESYTREARFLTRWDQHSITQEVEEEDVVVVVVVLIRNLERARRFLTRG